jgi:mono/diheme cytochrome c family protein
MKNKLTLVSLAALLSFLIFNACEQDKYTHGRILYENYCENCHQEDGTALEQLIPPLAGSDYLTKYKEKVACLIYYGIDEEIVVNGVTYKQVMPPNTNFNDIDIANIINYINNSFGNKNGYTPLKEVQEYLNNCEGN